MTHDQEKPAKSEIDSAYIRLDKCLHDESLLELAAGDGPLLIAELDSHIRKSDKFIKFVDRYDWPSKHDDGGIEPVPKFDDSQQFLKAMTDGVEIDGRMYYLNNFKNWLSEEPNEDKFDGGSMSRFYGSSPALQRAYLIAPEFMTALRTAYNSLPKQAYFPSSEALHSSAGEPVVAGARVAYMLLGRLLKTDDMYRHHELVFGSSGRASHITDAASTLSG